MFPLTMKFQVLKEMDDEINEIFLYMSLSSSTESMNCA